MPSNSILILNPKGNSGNRTSINRARRYHKKGHAVWVVEGVSIRFVDQTSVVPVTPTGPRMIQPARFTITREMIRSINLRTCTPIWPSQEDIKYKDGQVDRTKRLADRKRIRESGAPGVTNHGN